MKTRAGKQDWRLRALTRRDFGVVITGAAFGAALPGALKAAGAPWSVVIVPDPQYLASVSTGCSLYQRMIQWAIENRNTVVNGSPLNIKGFIQVGDCQNTASSTVANSEEMVAVNAWAPATASNLFVAWCCGNHDYESGITGIDRAKIGHAWRTDTGGAWAPANLASKYGSGLDLGGGDFAVWGGIYKDPIFPESSINNYIRLQIASRKILVISLEFFPRSSVLNWAKGLHDTYGDHEVWVTTHGFMDTLGNRCDRSQWGPGTYNLADAPVSNTGQQMWGGSDPTWAGFTQWPRLGLITCGHWINGYSGGWVWQKRREIGAAGQNTLQLFCNAQEADAVNACTTSALPDRATDVAHLMLLRIWPTTCEAYMLSTNTGKWTGAPGVRSNPTPVALFSEPFGPAIAPGSVVIGGVSNSASGQPAVASGSWVSIYGANLAGSTRLWQNSDFIGPQLPISLDGVSVTVNGKNAAVYYISPTQLNVQAPGDTATGPVQVQVTNSFGTAAGVANLQTYAPGFFTFQNRYAAAVHVDGAYVAPVGYFGSSVSSRPAKPGEILMVYGTGFGPTTPAVPAGQLVTQPAPLTNIAQLKIFIGGASAPVAYGGIVAAGEYQFNVTVPALSDGDQPITAEIAGISTQPGLVIPVKN